MYPQRELMMETVLPVHPFTGLTAVGVVAGRPVWPICGGSDDHDESGEQEPETDDESDDEAGDEDKPLGPAGERALAAEKTRRKAESLKRRELESKVAELEAKLNKPSDDAAPDIDSIKADALREASAAAASRIVKSEVKAAAAGQLADPADAYRFLDLSEFEVDEDGNVDEGEIADAIADLIKRKPYLAAQGGAKKQHGSADGGARKGQQRPIQLTREQLKTMTPDQIEDARQKGRLNDVLGIK